MSNIRRYVVTECSMKRRRTLGVSIVCYTCGKEIMVGDVAVTRVRHNVHNGIRHEECARRVGIIE